MNSMLEFNKELLEEVEEYKNSNIVSPGMAFKTVFISYLSEVGESCLSDCNLIDFKKSNEKVKIDGYVYNEFFNTLTLLVSDYSPFSNILKIGKTEIDSNFKQAIKFFKLSLKSYFENIEESSDGFKAYECIKTNESDILFVKIILITNRKSIVYTPDDTNIGKVNITFDVWDIERLHQSIFQQNLVKPNCIELENKYSSLLPLIKVTGSDSQPYDCYVGSISGDLLAKIYNDEGQNLIEKNVRSFLQATGKINKGLKSSLKDEPEMFMAYNNGISTIADQIEVDDIDSGTNFVKIKKIDGWQIVNGGQTTASIYNAYKSNVNLENVSVQMKLVVLKSTANANEIVANISKYANSQNPIKISDFSANDEYHIKMERLSRTTFIPVLKGKSLDKWFYERARGQYLVELNRQPTPTAKREFKEHNPKCRCVSKTVAAKCMMCWMQKPFSVSKGLETNFIQFASLLKDGIIPEPTIESYTRMVAQVILFNECDKIVANQNFPGYKAQIDYYTISLLSWAYSEKVDLSDIWKNQSITLEISKILEDLVYFVWEHFQNSPTVGVNIGQWCKKEDCWTLLKERYLKRS